MKQLQLTKYQHQVTVQDLLDRLDDEFCLKIFQQKFPDWKHVDNAKYVRGVELEHVFSDMFQLSGSKVSSIIQLLDKSGLLMAVTQADLMDLISCLTKTVGLPKMSLKIFFSRLDLEQENVKVLAVSTQQIEYTYKSLQALGANQQQIVQLIMKYPHILYNLDIDILQNNVIKLKQTQLLGDIQNFFQLCLDHKFLLKKDVSSKIEQLNPFLREEMNLSQIRIQNMIIQNPSLLGYHLRGIMQQNVQIYRQKYDVLKSQLGGGVEDIILWPQYLTCNIQLDELRNRLDFLKQNGYQIILPSKRLNFDINVLKIIPLQYLVTMKVDFERFCERQGLVFPKKK